MLNKTQGSFTLDRSVMNTPSFLPLIDLGEKSKEVYLIGLSYLSFFKEEKTLDVVEKFQGV